MERYFQIQNAFTGTSSQTGSDVDSCKTFLNMQYHSKHEAAQVLDLSVTNIFPKLGEMVKFLDSQINGAVFMLQRMFGRIPIVPRLGDNPGVRDVARRLESIRTFGGIVRYDGLWQDNHGASFHELLRAILSSYYRKWGARSPTDSLPSAFRSGIKSMGI